VSGGPVARHGLGVRAALPVAPAALVVCLPWPCPQQCHQPGARPSGRGPPLRGPDLRPLLLSKRQRAAQPRSWRASWLWAPGLRPRHSTPHAAASPRPAAPRAPPARRAAPRGAPAAAAGAGAAWRARWGARALPEVAPALTQPLPPPLPPPPCRILIVPQTPRDAQGARYERRAPQGPAGPEQGPPLGPSTTSQMR
jgi:hypothetical protein